MNTLGKILDLMEKNKINALTLEKELKFSNATISAWKRDKAKPSAEALSKIADYFNVSVDYLLGRELPPNIHQVDGLLIFPVIASISAGFDKVPILDESGEFIPIPSDLIKGLNTEDYFVLTVKGDSMYPKFLDGDHVLIKKCSSVDSGTIAVIIYNGEEATLKKVEYKTNEPWLKLIPTNPEYQTKKIEGQALEDCHVLGKVVYLLRKF